MTSPRRTHIMGFFFFALLGILAEGDVCDQWSPSPTNSLIYFLDKEKTPLVGFTSGTDLWRTSDIVITNTSCSPFDHSVMFQVTAH